MGHNPGRLTNTHPCKVICQKQSQQFAAILLLPCSALEQRNENMQCYECNWVIQFVDTF